ncbi:hypothetical protein BS47DRAFT_61327 [Hydnum rufescens UP504]|uniref:Uncharacterized protein n=1 Tax=Hydnum rufescens UP504 TaxID=1448309 RepID=A0A9P6ARQ3_9AGAM|nr:hypothetical protein BS47DRAFT_61327 [Hydnum rufescens UP504]
MLFIERDFEPARPNIEVDTEISIYFQDEVIREEGFPMTAPLETGTHLFTTEDNVKVLKLRYKYCKYLMSRYHRHGSTEFDIVFVITTIERTRDIVRANLGLLQVNNDIRHLIMGELDLRSIQNLETGLHKQPRPPGMQSEAIAMYRFHVALVRYFPDPSEFATIMLQTGTIIGGSTALSIVAGGTWVPGDLDLIVARRYLPRLVDYLKQQGYRFDRDISWERRGHYVHSAEDEPLYSPTS